MNILIVRYGSIGDSILISGMVREIRTAYPDALIDVLGDKVSKPVFEFCPYIDNFIEMQRIPKFFLIKYPKMGKFIKLFKKYDKIIYSRSEHFIGMAAMFAGVRDRIGYLNSKSFTNKGIVFDKNLSVVDFHYKMLENAGIKIQKTNTEVWIGDIIEAKVKCFSDKLNPDHKKVVVLQAGASNDRKNWINEYWAELLKYLDKRGDVIVLLTGSEKDIPLYNKIMRCSENEFITAPVMCAGQLSVQETMALIKNCDLFVGIDSFMAHAAAALDKHSVFIHGASPLVMFSPYSKKCRVLTANLPCSPCIISRNIECRNNKKCLREITPEKVIGEIEKCL